MLCYRDKTFCKYYVHCKHGNTCDRALTPMVKLKASVWWGKKNPPIAIFTEEPECYEEINECVREVEGNGLQNHREIHAGSNPATHDNTGE